MMIVWDIKFVSSLFNNRTERRIVDTAYSWEKVVFNLKIESAHKPAERLVIAGKIICGNHFVDHPVLVNHVLIIRQRMIGLFNHMGKLKNNPDNQSGCQVQC